MTRKVAGIVAAITVALGVWLGASDISANEIQQDEANADAGHERTMRIIAAEEVIAGELRGILMKGGTYEQMNRRCLDKVFDRGNFALRCGVSTEFKPDRKEREEVYRVFFLVFKNREIAREYGQSPPGAWFEQTDTLLIGRVVVVTVRGVKRTERQP